VGVRLAGASEDRTAVLWSRTSGDAFPYRDDALLGQSARNARISTSRPVRNTSSAEYLDASNVILLCYGSQPGTLPADAILDQSWAL